MEACVFNSSMLVLVNGSVTKDYKVEKGFGKETRCLLLFLLWPWID